MSAPPSGSEVEGLAQSHRVGVQWKGLKIQVQQGNSAEEFSTLDRRRLVSPLWKEDNDVYAPPS